MLAEKRAGFWIWWCDKSGISSTFWRTEWRNDSRTAYCLWVGKWSCFIFPIRVPAACLKSSWPDFRWLLKCEVLPASAPCRCGTRCSVVWLLCPVQYFSFSVSGKSWDVWCLPSLWPVSGDIHGLSSGLKQVPCSKKQITKEICFIKTVLGWIWTLDLEMENLSDLYMIQTC